MRTDRSELRRLPRARLPTSESIESRRQIRNLLASIRAIVQRTAMAAPSVNSYVSHLVGRLDALARTQELLMRDSGDQVDLAEIVTDEFLSQGIAMESVVSSSVSLKVDRTVAAALALALHELATNAIKFGQLHLPQRRIDVRWGTTDKPRGWAVLEWREQALPARDTADIVPGFGFELIRNTLRYEIGAESRIDLTPEGLQCEIRFNRAGVRT